MIVTAAKGMIITKTATPVSIFSGWMPAEQATTFLLMARIKSARPLTPTVIAS